MRLFIFAMVNILCCQPFTFLWQKVCIYEWAMNEIPDTIGRQTFSFVSSANSHFAGPHGDSSPAEAPPRGALYEVHRFISLEKAKLLALLIVLGCACNHALLRYKYGIQLRRYIGVMLCFFSFSFFFLFLYSYWMPAIYIYTVMGGQHRWAPAFLAARHHIYFFHLLLYVLFG